MSGEQRQEAIGLQTWVAASTGTSASHAVLRDNTEEEGQNANEKPKAYRNSIAESEKHQDTIYTTQSQSDEPIKNETNGSARLSLIGGQQESSRDEYISGIKLALVLIAITIVYFLVMLDTTIVATAIPYITHDFHSLLDVGWYGSAYLLSSSTLQPLSGKIYSKLNSKWCFVVYLVLFEVGSVISGAASSSIMLILGRVVSGIGGSGLLNGNSIILNSCVPPHRQPAYVGLVVGIGNLGLAIGPLLGGAFTQYVAWRWCFYINLPIGALVALVIVLIRIPDHIEKPALRVLLKNAVTDFDLLGFALFAPAAIMLFLALQWGGNQYAWNSPQVIGLFCGAAATFIVWLVWDYYQGENAMVPFSMMKIRVVWASCAAGFFMNGSMFITAYYLPIYFQAVLGSSPFISGVEILPNILATMVFSVMTGALIQRIGYYTPFILAGAALNTVGCGLLTLLTPATSTARWIGYQIVMGTGRGLGSAVPVLAIQNSMNSIRKEMVPEAISTLVFLQMFSAALMVITSQTILTNSLVDLVPQDAPGVAPELVINAGTTAADIRQAVGLDKLPGVLWAYASSLQRVWYFAAGVSAVAFGVGWCLGWENIRKKAELETRESAEALKARYESQQQQKAERTRCCKGETNAASTWHPVNEPGGSEIMSSLITA
ncbi:MFS general substrate transporter [Hypoxylon sp. FL1284]|nr:MFS general substrate transporter [Hypoxylon sp. FL1284]